MAASAWRSRVAAFSSGDSVAHPARRKSGKISAERIFTTANSTTPLSRAIIQAMTRWIAAAGAFVVSLDSMVNIAFPSMAAAFRLPPEAMRWVIICYVGTYALMSFGGGALADRVGHGRVFRAGLALSAVGFVLSGTAPTFGWLLGGRVGQGGSEEHTSEL